MLLRDFIVLDQCRDDIVEEVYVLLEQLVHKICIGELSSLKRVLGVEEK